MSRPENLRRLLAPESVAMVGGDFAAAAARQCRLIGYPGPVWPVHPTRPDMAGIACYPDLASLPGVPDAAFVSVSSRRTVEVVAGLRAMGVGGVVVHASGFAEAGHDGARLQDELVVAAGPMAMVGPNCLGMLNYLDGVALWPEQHGGVRVDRGVAVIAQSGNIAQNLTMQRRSLPIAQLVTIGNAAQTGVVDLVEGMLADPRITAIGLHLEQVADVVEFARVATEALRRRIPIVVLKAGSSELGAQVTFSHTSSLAGSDVLADALFARLGIARVEEVGTFLETLKLLHVLGPLPGRRIASASCSGGEAAYVADLARHRGLELPPLTGPALRRLRRVLGPRVSVRNPLDYHTYVWGHPSALTSCFTALLGQHLDAHLLVLDLPRGDRCDAEAWEEALEAYVSAQRATGAHAVVVSSLPEGTPEHVGRRLIEAGIAPMQGVADCLTAIDAAATVGEAQSRVPQPSALLPPRAKPRQVVQFDEVTAKQLVSRYDVQVPRGTVVPAATAADAAISIGFPVVVKALGSTLAHKSELGAVAVGLGSPEAVEKAVAEMVDLSGEFLVEQMVVGAVAELVVAVRHDPRFGPVLTVGAGGVLVELLDDTVTLLLPTTSAGILGALEELRIWPVVAGYRGRGGDVGSVLAAVESVVDLAMSEPIVEVEVNPLLVLPAGAVAVDVLLRVAADG